MDVHCNNNALAELNNCIGGLLHFGLIVTTLKTSLHFVPNIISFRTLLHSGQLLHLGLKHTCNKDRPQRLRKMIDSLPY